MILQPTIKFGWGGTLFNKIYSIFLIPGGRVGVALFFTITGYFQINRAKISLKKVVIETIFYAIFIQVVAVLLEIGSLGALVRSIIPIASGSWWYVSSYVLLMFCSPTINTYYLKLNAKQKRFVLAFVWLFLYLLPYIFGAQYYSLERGILFYLIGAYIHTEVNVNKLRRPLLILGAILLWIAYIPIGYGYYSFMNKSRLFDIMSDGVLFNGVIVVGCSVLLFLIFVSIKPFSNKIINLIAKSTFGIYLLHDNVYREYLWNNLFQISAKYQNLWFPIIAVMIGILIFGVCFIIDYIRDTFFTLNTRKLRITE